VSEKARGQSDIIGDPIMDSTQFEEEWNSSFEFKFIDVDDLMSNERDIFKKTEAIMRLIGGRPINVKEIKISETMRMDDFSFTEAAGIWEANDSCIIIKRSQLQSLKDYAGTLLHEIAHAISGATDVSSEFEQCLTSLLGRVVSNI